MDKIVVQLKNLVLEAVKKAYPDVEIKLDDIVLEHPTVEEYGDYSTNIAMRLKIDPQKVLEHLPEGWSVVGRFLNYKIPQAELVNQMQLALNQGERYGNLKKNGKTIVIELVSPNINKPLHIGHLRNGALGMSLSNIYEAAGWKVIKDEINNDRGLHIMKSMLGYLIHGQKNKKDDKFGERNWKALLSEWVSHPEDWDNPNGKIKPDYFVGHFYVQGERLLTDFKEPMEKNLAEMLQAWEAEDKDIWKLWKTMSDWVHQGIDATYERIGVQHDKKWYEHLLYKEGKNIIDWAVKKHIFEKLPDGAIQVDLKKYGYDNKILVRRDGTAIYMTFDIALTRHKVMEFKADKYVWVVGNDQIDHFKRLFVIFEMLGLGKKDDFYHLAYGMVRVPGGKMSSRLGNVILADDMLDRIKIMAEKLSPETAEGVAVGAVKYALLKVDPMATVTFDLEKSVSLDGDSGPYIQYTYARAKSVLRKSNGQWTMSRARDKSQNNVQSMKNEELAILRFLYRFPEVVEAAAKQYAPNIICTYLFELAKRFNNLYNNCPILENEFRLALTEAVSITLKNGLNLLGIQELEKM